MWIKRVFPFYIFSSEKDRRLKRAIEQIVGFKPLNLSLFRLAVKHTSIARENTKGLKESNERLEYLGDAVLGMIVAEYLFKKYPYKEEGFLTEIRSRIVNRESLSQLAVKIGLNHIVEYNQSRKHAQSFKSLNGDCLEALIGAIYLDRGQKKCRQFIVRKLLRHLDLEQVVKNNPNNKSQLIEWAHQERKQIRFEIVEVKSGRHFKEFVSEVYLDEKAIAKGMGLSKKKAEQDAARRGLIAVGQLKE